MVEMKSQFVQKNLTIPENPGVIQEPDRNDLIRSSSYSAKLTTGRPYGLNTKNHTNR